MQAYFGGGRPADPQGPAFQVGLPWGAAPDAPCLRVVPTRLELTPDILELAALQQLKQRPLPARVLGRVDQRLSARSPWFRSLLKNAYAEAEVVDKAGKSALPPLGSIHRGHTAWLNTLGEWVLRQTYPLFERFAPGSGPLSHESYRVFMRFAAEHDICAQDAPDAVRLIREAYLVPMGLMQRKGVEYTIAPRLENNELVRHLAQILEHHPSPARVYEHLGAPLYGLLPDQIHLLLLVLLQQGELDIVKGEHSYRDTFETLVNPLQYDRVLPGQALSLEQLRNLQSLCEAFRIPVPRQWNVLAQKRAIQQLRKFGGGQRDLLSSFVSRLKASGETGAPVTAIEELISKWLTLDKGEHELHGFQIFERAIGPVDRFVASALDMALLPQKYDGLLRETQRFRHLLAEPALSRCPEPDIATRLQALGPPPALSQPEELDAWLRTAQAVYDAYAAWYRPRHEQWREDVGRHPLWHYQIPRIARSRHVMAGPRVAEIEALISEAKARRCGGLTALDFQPLCRCGFDGSEGPITATLSRFDAVSQELARELDMFFQQDKVKAKVRDWVDQGLETNSGTLSFLEAKRPYPEIGDLALFDQHLSGLELVQPVESEAVLELLGDRVWDKAALMAALSGFFERLGPRIALRRRAPASRQDLIAWCYEQALTRGQPLPSVFSRSEQQIAAELMDPKWVSGAGLQRLEELNLGEEVLLRVLGMLLDGRVDSAPALQTGPVAAALDLLHPRAPATVAELAALVQCLYRQHARLVRLRRREWLGHLDRLASGLPADAVAPLELRLNEALDAQWVVVDCLGLPILDAVASILPDSLPRWTSRSAGYAVVPGLASTDAFYLSLLGEGFKKPFEKINVVDDLVHERRPDLAELEQLVRAELGIALKRMAPRLDPAKPVLIFGDHGFRLSADGKTFTHGGDSILERTTGTFLLA